jgi:hypothetical protein
MLAGLEATFVPAPAGMPPRHGRLALWVLPGHSTTDGPGGDRALAKLGAVRDTVELVIPAGSRVRRRTLEVDVVALGDLLDSLAGLPTHGDGLTPSMGAWATAARHALELISRGRLLPGVAGGGGVTDGVRAAPVIDAWRVGPLDPADLARRAQLAAAMPPAAHALAVTGARPLRVRSPEALVAAFTDAVADTLVRTAAAPLVAGHDAFAAAAPVPIDGPARDWLVATGAGGTEDAVVALRLAPPDGPDEPFGAVLQLQSARDPSLVIDAADLWEAPETVLALFGDDVDTRLLLTLRRGCRVWEPLARLLDEARPARLALDDDEAEQLLGGIVDELAGAGISVLWPADLVRPVDLRPVASPTPGADRPGAFSLQSVLELRFEASLDGQRLSESELAVLAEAKRPMVRLRGRWVRADPALLERLARRRTMGAGAALGLALGGTVDVDGEHTTVEVQGPLAELAERLAALSGDRRREPPPALTATLRPYQERGLAWLSEMAELGLGGVLADDMGLGKTVQLLALHLERRHAAGPTLVVCPVTLVANWEREAARFAPDVPVRRYHGADRRLDDLRDDELVLTTYGVVRRDHEALAGVEWDLVVADEAQALKNPLARTARSIRAVPAAARLALTGTPVENRLVDLWALLDWTTPGLLGPLERFRRDVAVPVERDRDAEATEQLTRLVRPFLLRRRKSDPDIVPDLPPKTETDRFVPLTAEQATLYRAVVTETMAAIEEAEGIARRGLVLKLLTALKQICNHPAHYLGQDGPLAARSTKLDAATDLLGLVRDEGDAALVFTQYVAMGRLLERHLTEAGLRVGFLHGSLSLKRRQGLVDDFQAGGTDVLVLSLKAGGTGLNLTRATEVVHYDRWWNPAVEDQASDRAWRIGQDRPVQVHRLVCEGTVEDRVAALLADKRALADAVVGEGEGWVSELSDDALRSLVALSDDDRGSADDGGDSDGGDGHDGGVAR